MISFNCPHCDKLLKTADDKAGRSANCPGCGEVVEIPALQTVPPADSDDPFASLTQSSAPPEVSGSGDDRPRRPCPMCGGLIIATAVRCRHCGEMLGDASHSATSPGEPVSASAGDIFNRAWNLYKADLGLIVGGWFVVSLLTNLSQVPLNIVDAILQHGGNADATTQLALVFANIAISMTVGSFLQSGLAVLMLNIATGRRAEFSDIFRGGRYFLRYLAVSILFGLMVAFGTLLLIVPGILAALLFWPVFMVVVNEDRGVFDAFGRAYAIASKNIGTSFLLGLIVFGLGILGVAMCLVGLIFTAPLGVFTMVVGYLAMSGAYGRPRTAF